MTWRRRSRHACWRRTRPDARDAPRTGRDGWSMLLAACSSTPRHGNARIKSLPPPGNVADAVPRAEPRSSHGNPPFYEVNGQRYAVLASADNYVERGVASWYGPDFHGHNTSSGERYDMYGMTAAHKTLPIPCYARITNLSNGRSVVVRINDRGPFVGNRIVDLVLFRRDAPRHRSHRYRLRRAAHDRPGSSHHARDHAHRRRAGSGQCTGRGRLDARGASRDGPVSPPRANRLPRAPPRRRPGLRPNRPRRWWRCTSRWAPSPTKAMRNAWCSSCRARASRRYFRLPTPARAGRCAGYASARSRASRNSITWRRSWRRLATREARLAND